MQRMLDSGTLRRSLTLPWVRAHDRGTRDRIEPHHPRVRRAYRGDRQAPPPLRPRRPADTGANRRRATGCTRRPISYGFAGSWPCVRWDCRCGAFANFSHPAPRHSI
jgi:hypothetical protein